MTAAISPRKSLLALHVALVTVALAGAVDARSAAQAGRAAPWCAAQGGLGGGFDCSYYSFEQCMETARGLGNFCTPNPLSDRVQHRRRVRK